jgi:hypothetical protein
MYNFVTNMENKIVNKETIIKSITKMVADKAVVRSFLKGKTTIESLTQKGIKLAKPL